MVVPLSSALLNAEYRNANRFDQLLSLGTLAVPALLGSKLLEISTGANRTISYAIARVADDLSLWLTTLTLAVAVAMSPLFRRRMTRYSARLPRRDLAGFLIVYWVFALLASVYLLAAFSTKSTLFQLAGAGSVSQITQSFEGAVHLGIVFVGSLTLVSMILCFRPIRDFWRVELAVPLVLIALTAALAYGLRSAAAGLRTFGDGFGVGSFVAGIVVTVVWGAVATRLLRWAYRRQLRFEHGRIKTEAYRYHLCRSARDSAGSRDSDWRHAERSLFGTIWPWPRGTRRQ